MINFMPDLNFLTEFELSRNGMISEIIKEFNVLRLAFGQRAELGNECICERKNPSDQNANTQIYDLMDKAGYYKLTVYDFIKHLSDKRGAYIDQGIAPLVKIINGNQNHTCSVFCGAVDMCS